MHAFFRSRILSSGCRGVLPIAIRALYTLKSFLQHFACRAGQTVCLCIDNYTAPLLVLPETQRTEVAEALELSLFHTIGPCVIKGYIRKGFIVGEWDVPCEPDEWAASESRGPYMDTDHGLFHVCVDLTHFPLMQEAFGFVDSEVRKMDEAVGRLPNVEAAGDILNYLNDPQYFARRYLYMGETEKRDVYGTTRSSRDPSEPQRGEPGSRSRQRPQGSSQHSLELYPFSFRQLRLFIALPFAVWNSRRRGA